VSDTYYVETQKQLKSALGQKADVIVITNQGLAKQVEIVKKASPFRALAAPFRRSAWGFEPQARLPAPSLALLGVSAVTREVTKGKTAEER